MRKIYTIIVLLGAGCATSEKKLDTLHDYPIIDPKNCPIPLDMFDDEFLKAKAMAVNMRYVDYLHALTNNRIPELRKREQLGANK